MKPSPKSHPFLRKHSLSLGALAVVIVLVALYRWSSPSTHIGSFFGNAIADWTGVFVTIVMTKFLYEKGSAESKQPKGNGTLRGSGITARAFAHNFSCDHRNRLGNRVLRYGPGQQVGTG